MTTAKKPPEVQGTHGSTFTVHGPDCVGDIRLATYCEFTHNGVGYLGAKGARELAASLLAAAALAEASLTGCAP
jgi:hypothetical protein